MKSLTYVKVLLAVAVGVMSADALAEPVGSAFTYQGQLKNDGRPVNEPCEFHFSLWDALAPGTGHQIGTTVVFDGANVVNVAHGHFTVVLDFGPNAFNGRRRWLEIYVRNSQGDARLTPRQEVTTTPYASTALTTIGVDGHSLDADDGSPVDAVYVNDRGYTGIGTTTPEAPLHVRDWTGSVAVYAENPGEGMVAELASERGAVYAEGGLAVKAVSNSGTGKAVHGMATAIDGVNYGVYGQTASRSGHGVMGLATSTDGGYGVYGAVGSPQAYAGYFDGRGYFSGNVGVGTTDPSSPLTVNGIIETKTGGIKFPDGTTQTTASLGGGSSPWTNDGEDNIYYGDGYVGVGVGSADPLLQPLHVGGNGYFDGTVGIGTPNTSSHLTVGGVIESTVGGIKFPDGTTQTTASLGGGSSLWILDDEDNIYYGDGFVGISVGSGDTLVQPLHVGGASYFEGNVGIGVTNPTAALDVNGTVNATGLKLGSSATVGHVLTADANGLGTWQAPTGADSPWETDGYNLYYTGGSVGVGVSSPQANLHVAGGNWDVSSGEGDFKIGSSTYRLKMGVATSGGGAGTCRIVAGGPSSKLVLGANGSELMTVSSTMVDVNSMLEANAIRLTSGANFGYVLTSDGSGTATWQPPPTGGGGFDLPYDGSAAVNGDSALKITNTGTGNYTHAIEGVITNASSDSAAGYFNAIGFGSAIHAESDNQRTIYARNSGGGQAVYGSSDGSGGGRFSTSMDGGYGVRGSVTSSGSSTESRGGWFTATNGTNGVGVLAEGKGKGLHATASNGTGVAVRAEATGAESVGVYATSPWIAVQGSSAYEAARLAGRVRVRRYGTSDTVFLVDSDGITKVDVLQILGGADLSEQFDVKENEASKAEPGMVVCIDPDSAGKLIVSEKAYDRTVAGIISGAGGVKTGMMMGQTDTLADGAHPVALTGRVYVWADASNGPITPGDLLTTSDTPGHAMKITDYGQSHGATLGKAMTSLDEGRGLVLVLVTLQ